jgi:hypothetical protein
LKNLGRIAPRAREGVSRRHCLRQTRSACARERKRRSNPFFLCTAMWIASLRSQ